MKAEEVVWTWVTVPRRAKNRVARRVEWYCDHHRNPRFQYRARVSR